MVLRPLLGRRLLVAAVVFFTAVWIALDSLKYGSAAASAMFIAVSAALTANAWRMATANITVREGTVAVRGIFQTARFALHDVSDWERRPFNRSVTYAALLADNRRVRLPYVLQGRPSQADALVATLERMQESCSGGQ